jgi:peptidyl-prolyl cis-trans isomerase SurA
MLDRVVASVNNEVITWSELRKAIEFDRQEELKGLDGDERENTIRRYERQVLNDLIDLRLQIQEARRLGLDVSPSEVEGAIEDIKKKYGITREELLNSLKAEGLTEESYRKELSEQILLAKVINLEVRSKIVISDREIEEYYKENKEIYNKERVRIRQIFLRRSGNGSIKDIQKKVEEIIKRLEAGEDFSDLARELSEDRGGKNGGDLGYVEKGTILKEVEDVAFSLKVGEVSKPFWSARGLHIIKVEDRIESGLDEAKERIRQILFQKAFQKRYEDWIKSLREKAYIEINL